MNGSGIAHPALRVPAWDITGKGNQDGNNRAAHGGLLGVSSVKCKEGR